MKKVLKITGISLLVLLIAAIVLPIIFKDKIVGLVKNKINEQLTAKVEFGGTSLSFFRSFPKLSLRLEDLSVAGNDEFSKDTLLSAENFDVALNIMSLFGDKIEVAKIALQSPRIHAIVHKNGKANWDITKPDTTTTLSTDTSATSFQMALQSYDIHDGYVYYKDETAAMEAEIFGLNHEGTGNFTQDEFTLSTTTEAASASFSYEGIAYLAKTHAEIKSDFLIDQKTGTYHFNNSDILLNNLKIRADGFFRLATDSSYDMDIKFDAPSTEFKDLLSLVPSLYQSDFSKIQTSGQASFKGFVKGTYSPVEMPAYDVALNVRDGFFKYPDLPKPLQHINIDLKATNPDGVIDHGIVNISKGHIEMDKDPFDFTLIFTNPETKQFIDASAKGRIDLSQIGQFVKLPAGTSLAGLMTADVFAKGNMKDLNQQSGDFKAGGFINLASLHYAAKEVPAPIENGSMRIDIANNNGIADLTSIKISQGHIEIGKDPIDFDLALTHPVSNPTFDGHLKGNLQLAHLEPFGIYPTGAKLGGSLAADLNFAGNQKQITDKAYNQIRTSGLVKLDKFSFSSPDYPDPISIDESTLAFSPEKVSLRSFKGNYMQSNFDASGEVNNLIGYLFSTQVLQGSLSVNLDKMNLNTWMGADTTTTTADTSASSPFPVPANLDLRLNARAGSVTYDKVDYRNVVGTLLLKDERVTLDGVSTEALDGKIGFNGYYSTKQNKAKPDISIQYKIQDVNIQKAFYAFNTVQKLMPVGQYLSGKVSSSLSLNGKLNGELMPDLATLAGNGNLLLLEGVLKQFAPLEKIASTLQIQELKEITLKDLKSSIEFSNGQVLVKPFTVKVKDIEMQIGGLHGFNQQIQYLVQMKLPRKYLGQQGNNLVNGLAAKASAKGVPVQLGDIVNLNIKVGGTMTSPTIQTDLKEAAGDAAKEMQAQAMTFAKQKVDSAKQTLKDTATAIRKQVVSDVKSELRNQLFGNKDSLQSKPLDSTKKKAVESVKNTFGKLLGKKKG